MIKNRFIALLLVFFATHAAFSYKFPFLHSIKAKIDSFLQKNLHTDSPYAELCGKDLAIIADHTLNHVISMEDVVEELESLQFHFINDKEPIISKIIVTGDSRTGKTFLIEGFIGSAQQTLERFGLSTNTLWINIPMIKKYGISNILKLIQLKAPVIIYIDEDGITGEFKAAHAILLEFLLHFEQISKNFTAPIILFFATNKFENLDSALKIRFNKEIHCEYPNFEERKIYIERQFKKFNINPTGFDLNFLARACKSAPYEKINYILYTALAEAGKQGVPLVAKYFRKNNIRKYAKKDNYGKKSSRLR